MVATGTPKTTTKKTIADADRDRGDLRASELPVEDAKSVGIRGNDYLVAVVLGGRSQNFSGELVHQGLDRDDPVHPAGVRSYGKEGFFLVGVISRRAQQAVTDAEAVFIAFLRRAAGKLSFIILQEHVPLVTFRLTKSL